MSFQIEIFFDDFLTLMFSIMKLNFLQSDRIGIPMIHNIILDLNFLEADLKKLSFVKKS